MLQLELPTSVCEKSGSSSVSLWMYSIALHVKDVVDNLTLQEPLVIIIITVTHVVLWRIICNILTCLLYFKLLP